MPADKWLQPRSYHAFHCLGAECEDTCCAGWIVQIDKPTYEAYQRCEDPEFGPRLRELVTINAAGATPDNYARIAFSGPACPFLSSGLCGIQNKLGTSFLSIMCSQYPRVMNSVDDVLQRSLDLSCPEAARIVLLDPNPMAFDDTEATPHDARLGHLSVLQTSGADSAKPYAYFHEIRSFVIWLLQYRAYNVGKRLVLLGAFCDELQATAEAGNHSQIPEVIAGCREAADSDLFGAALSAHRPRPAAQLELVLELIVARITSDFTHPRFLACYQEFKQGIEWTSESTMDEIGQRYAAVHAKHYSPFLGRHEYMLEHYLVNYAHQTLFPLGPQETTRGPGAHHVEHSIREQCLMMMVQYGIVQALLIGAAGFHQTEMTPAHAVKVIQSFTKAFEHSLAFPEHALRLLAAAGLTTCVNLALLLQ